LVVFALTPPRARSAPQAPYAYTAAQLANDALHRMLAFASETAARAAADAADEAAARALAPPLPKPAASASAAEGAWCFMDDLEELDAALAAAAAPAAPAAPRTRDAATQTRDTAAAAPASSARTRPARAPPPPPPPRPHAPPRRAASASKKLHTGAAAPWERCEDAALRAAVAEIGPSWERIRAAVVNDGRFAPLLAHLGAPASKCLRKRWAKLTAWDTEGMAVAYKR
jgi:hypothetical protein